MITGEDTLLNEEEMSKEMYEIALEKAMSNPSKLESVCLQVDAMHGIVMCEYKELSMKNGSLDAPMVVSQYLRCLKSLRTSLDMIFDLSTSQQEEIAWKVLNACKLIYRIGQPLVFHYCGKYVVDTFLYAATCMESIITLCTVRHLKFRMKLYNTAFIAVMSHGSLKEAKVVLTHTTALVSELKTREELDPPVPDKIKEILSLALDDVSVMTTVYKFFENPDDVTEFLSDGDSDVIFGEYSPIKMSRGEKMLCECIRVHHLTSGAANEAWKKRATCIARIFSALKAKFNPEVEVVEPVEGEEPPLAPPVFLFSLSCLIEIALILIFDPIDEEVVPVNELISYLWSQLAIHQANLVEQRIQPSTELLDSQVAKATVAVAEGELSMHEWGLKELSILQQLLGMIQIYKQEAKPDGEAVVAGSAESGETPEEPVPETEVTPAITLFEASLGIIENIEEIMYSVHERRIQHLLHRVVLCIWGKIVYPKFHEVLGQQATFSAAENASRRDGLVASAVISSTSAAIEKLAPLVLIIVRVLDVTHFDDAVLFSSISIISGLILRHIGDYRSALGILKQSLVNLENFRAARVDATMHLPEDKRDILSLQRASFSTNSTENDWFYAVKRLGTRAYAGYGVFGTCSMSDRTDQALAELHVDMLSLYFKCELEYAIKHKKDRSVLKNSSKNGSTTVKKGGTSVSTSVSVAPGTSIPSATMKTFSNSNTVAMNGTEYAVESLPCVAALKASCSRNLYAKTLLIIEMLRLEATGVEATRMGLLNTAKDYILELEARETILKQSFLNLDIVRGSSTEGGHGHSQAHYPLVLARSNKAIYVVPVGTRSTQKKAEYYRIFTKEEGSGTAVSFNNNDMPGSEKRVLTKNLTSPSAAIVTVSGLTAGERYVFGSGAFSASHEHIGRISDTSPPVDAVNPLPTIILWAILAEVAQDVGFTAASKHAARRVCDRFFDNPPPFDAVSLGKGINVSTDPHLCMLAIQQSSPVVLRYFIRSFLVLEAPLHERQEGSGIIHWDMKLQEQKSVIFSLRRIGLVLIVAAFIRSHELITRCICLGYAYLCYLIEYDEINMAPYIQQPLTVFIAVLQTIPKRHWKDLEHQLYCRLLSQCAKSAIINHSTGSVVQLLTDLYKETSSDNPADSIAKICSESILGAYNATISNLQLNGSIMFSQEAQEQLKLLFATEEDNVWKMDLSRRMYVINGHAAEIAAVSLNLSNGVIDVSPEMRTLEGSLKAFPDAGSQLLSALAQIATELRVQQSIYNRSLMVQLFGALMNSFPLQEEIFVANTRHFIVRWDLKFLKLVVLPPAEHEALESEGQKEEEVVVGASFDDTLISGGSASNAALRKSKTEEIIQIKAIATLSYMFAIACFDKSDCRQHYPADDVGPYAVIDPSIKKEKNKSLNKKQVEEPVEELKGFDLLVQPVDYIRYICAAIAGFVRANCPAMAISAAMTLWNHLVDEWQDPKDFSIEYKHDKKYLHIAGEELVCLFEAVLGENEEDHFPVESVENMEHGALDISICQRDIKGYLFQCRDLFIYLIKVLWLLEEFSEVVEVGNRVLSVYMTPVGNEYSKTFDSILPLMLHAQEQLLHRSQVELDRMQRNLELYVTDYEEQQRKKRKKKVRIARLEKDDSELKFEADKAVLEDRIYRADMAKKNCQGKLDALISKQKKFDALSSTSTQLLDKLRKGRIEVYNDCVKEVGIDGDFAVCMKVKDIREKIDGLFLNFNQVCHLFREKKDKITLIEALKEQADLYLLVGRLEDAKNCWRDAVDGLFNVMDTHKQWKTVVEKAVAHPDRVIIEGALPIVVILGKLSRISSASDWDGKAGCCRMAAAMCKVPFQDSYGHPTAINGFAAYVCRQLGGVLPLVANTNKLSIMGLHEALEEIVLVLYHEGCFLDVLPALVLWEHLHSNYTRRADHWFVCRLWRVRVLIKLHLFAEAASMLASIPTSIPGVLNGVFDNPLLRPPLADKKGTTSEGAAVPDPNTAYDTAENGLDYFGYSPFHNHLPPHHPDNVLCLKWIFELDTTIAGVFDECVYELPISKSDRNEYKQKLDEYNSQFIAYNDEVAAVAAAPKEKGKPAPQVTLSKPVPPDAPVAQTTPMFTELFLGELQYVCAMFLHTVSVIDNQLSNAHYNVLQLISKDCDSLLIKTLTTLASTLNKENEEGEGEGDQFKSLVTTIDQNVKSLWQSSKWTSLYGRTILLYVEQSISRRHLREARSMLLNFLQRLQSMMGQRSITGAVKSTYTQLWFSAKDLLVDIAMYQGRFHDVVKFTTNFSMETSVSFNGYWLRLLVLKRSIAYYKLGFLDESEEDCNRLYFLYNTAQLEDCGLIRSMVHRATVLREKVLNHYDPNGTTPHFTLAHIAVTMRKCIYWLKTAVDVCDRMTRCFGGYSAGADGNAAFEGPQSALLKHDIFSPLIHSLNSIHNNDAPLTIYANISEKILADVTKNLAANLSPEPPKYVRPEQFQRPGPVDENDVYVASPFANIYLKEMRVLVTCQAALCTVLDETRNSECMMYFEMENAAKKQGHIGDDMWHSSVSKLSLDDEDETEAINARIAQGQLDTKMSPLELLTMQSWVGEDALKVMRYTVYCPAVVRMSLLLNVARARVGKLLYVEPAPVQAPAAATARTVKLALPTVAEAPPVICDGSAFLSALTMALKLGTTVGPDAAPASPSKGKEKEVAPSPNPIAGSGSHDWKLLSTVCVELVECYGNTRLQFDTSECEGDGLDRLKMACLYLICACRLQNQSRTVLRSPLSLCASKAGGLTENVSSNYLTTILDSFVSTSCTPSYMTSQVVAAGGSPKTVVDSSAAPLTGRDAISLLSSTTRECDPLWLDGFERGVLTDVHHLLRTSYPTVFTPSCTLTSVPSADSVTPLSVLVGGMYSIWVTMNKEIPIVVSTGTTPGNSPQKAALKSRNSSDNNRSMFNHFTGYFLLGVGDTSGAPASPGKGAAAVPTNEISSAPFLTKVVLQRSQVVDIECSLRDLRTNLEKALINKSQGPGACAENLGRILVLIMELFGESSKHSNSHDNAKQIKYECVDDPSGGANMSVKVKIASDGEEDVVCSVPVDDECILMLANLFTSNMCVEGSVNTAVCSFLRMALLGAP